MADNAFKVTLLFDDHGTGWSETYYFTSLGQLSPKSFIDELVAERVKVLGVGVTMIGSRYNDTATPRDVKRYSFTKVGKADGGDGKTAKPVLADSPYLVALSGVKTARGTRRMVTLSGFPDEWVARPAEGNAAYLSEKGADKIRAWMDWLTGKAPVLQIRERKVTDAFAPKKVTEIVKDANGHYKFVYEGGAGLDVGDKVVITKAKGTNLARIRGTKKIIEKIDDNTFVLDADPTAAGGVVELKGIAYVSKVGYTYEPTKQDGDTDQVSSRKRGRPFSARRGRRTASR